MRATAPAPAPEAPGGSGRREPPVRLIHPAVLVVLTVLMVAVAGYGLHARGQGLTSADGAAAGEPLPWVAAGGTSLPSVGRVDGLAMPCTAFLLDTGSAADAPAYALTAGRCTGIDDATTVLYGEAISAASVTFRLFADAPAGARSQPVTVGVEQIAWASVRGTDLAVLELEETVGELADAGLPSVPVDGPLESGGQLLVAGVPVVGGADGADLRGSRCQAGARITVAEGPWLLRRAQSTDCVGTVAGTTGAPALDEAGAVVGVVSTTTVNAAEGTVCQLRRPCEVADGVVTVRPDATYLVDAAGLAACFPDGRFELGGGCPLEQPGTVLDAQLADAAVPADGPVTIEVAPPAPANLGVRTGMLGTTDCWAGAGWTSAPVIDGRITLSAPQEQGLALVCVGSPRAPTPLRLTVTAAGPPASAVSVTVATVPGGISLLPDLDPPEVTSMRWVLEPGTAGSCATVEGYQDADATQATFVAAADLPATLCVIAADVAGNASPPVAVRLAATQPSGP